MKHVIAYTDGACLGNPGPGGWGAVLECEGNVRHISGAEPNTTNNRMELMAAIETLRVLSSSCQITLYTDSKYVQQGMTEWLPNWKRRNWRSATGKAVKNKDLWESLDFECERHTMSWHWVKGHAGCEGNEVADRLATEAAARLIEE